MVSFPQPTCHKPTFGRVWGWHSHSRNGDLGVLRDSWNFRVRLQGSNTLPWGILYIIGKLSKCRCRKWPRMSHLDIFSTSYGKKKGQELNWQFDSQPLKVGNRPDLGMCRWSATHRWKALKESYKFASNLIPIGGLNKELRIRKNPGSLNRNSFGTPPWESWDKKPFECRCHGKTHRILYGRRWWLPLSPGRGESCESKVAHVLS